MGKNKNKNKKAKASQAAVKEEEIKLTMAALKEMSSSEDEGEMPPEEKWGKDAKELKKAIESGAFNKLLNNKDTKGDDESIEEASLDSDTEEEAAENSESQHEKNEEAEEAESDDESSDESNVEEDIQSSKVETKEKGENENDQENDDDSSESDSSDNDDVDNKLEKTNDKSDDDEEEDEKEEVEKGKPKSKMEMIFEKNDVSSKAMRVVTDSLRNEKKGWAWAETFDVMPTKPLPFGQVEGAEGYRLSVHDDLKREVAFYDNALEAVIEARKRCEEAKVPFTRPEDFFAEMVKTDEHMARVKDRLIFETKKMDAVAQRKSNKEQKLRSKEATQNKIAEKVKRKKEHFKAVEDWAQSAAQNRGSRLNDNDEEYLHSMGAGGSPPKRSKKRELADKKYGYGGKRGRFKQNDPKDLNSPKGFNRNGNFGGLGSKKTTSKNGSGGKRKGKRARDASRTRS